MGKHCITIIAIKLITHLHFCDFGHSSFETDDQFKNKIVHDKHKI